MNDTLPIIATEVLAADEDGLLLKIFGPHLFADFEPRVREALEIMYGISGTLDLKFYTLSNAGFFLAPNSAETKTLNLTNLGKISISSMAIGVASTLLGLTTLLESELAWNEMDWVGHLYLDLEEYAKEHSESDSIFRVYKAVLPKVSVQYHP